MTSAPRVFLVDTSVLLRLVDIESAQHLVAANAVSFILQAGGGAYITPQNLIEFWAVVTRPLEANGLSLPATEAAFCLKRFQQMFGLLPDTADIFEQWQSLVLKYEVRGKPTHDARLAAVMKVHNIDYVLTFNTSDFRRYSQDGISAVDPAEINAA